MNTYILIVCAIVISVVISFFVAKAKVGPMGPMGRVGAAGKAGPRGFAGGKITFGDLATLSTGDKYWGSGTNNTNSTAALGPNRVQKAKFRQQMATNTVNFLTGGVDGQNTACDPTNAVAYRSKSDDWRATHCGHDLMERLSKEVAKYLEKTYADTALKINVSNAVNAAHATKAETTSGISRFSHYLIPTNSNPDNFNQGDRPWLYVNGIGQPNAKNLSCNFCKTPIRLAGANIS